jgi:hypothetical protein
LPTDEDRPGQVPDPALTDILGRGLKDFKKTRFDVLAVGVKMNFKEGNIKET